MLGFLNQGNMDKCHSGKYMDKCQKGIRMKAIEPQHLIQKRARNFIIVSWISVVDMILLQKQFFNLGFKIMIKFRGLISNIKANLLTNRNAFPHKMEESWDSEFNQQNPKLNYLEKLLENNSIRPYFIEKNIKELEKQDIYFFMENRQLFHRIPRQTKQQLIKNPNANTVLKFHLALQLNHLRSEEVQSYLLDSFNSSINRLNTFDVIFCLELICSFKNISDDINYYALENKFLAEQNPQIFIKFVYLLSELNFQTELISKELVQEKISMLENMQIQTILHVRKISSFLKLQLTPYSQNRLRSSFLQKRRDFKDIDCEWIVQLLQYYPESANLLNTQCLNPQSYVSYLQFFIHDEQSVGTISIPKAIDHPIPQNIIAHSQVSQFYNIIKHRVTLELSTPESLVNNLKEYYTKNLNCIMAIIRYLQKEQKMTPQVQSVFQKSLSHKIIKNGMKLSFEEFKIVDIFKILGYLSVNNLGTINFWKKSLKFVTNAIQEAQSYKNLSGDQQKKFVVYLFQIFKSKPFPRQLEDQIINLTLLSLTINRWSMKQILPLTISLKVNKIGDNQLWFGIEQRINQINIRHIESVQDRKALKKIVYNFNMIGKGSYEFWSQINKNLNKKQKTQILNSFKIPSTMAHTYLKV